MDKSASSWPPGPMRPPDAEGTRRLRQVTLYGLGVNLLLSVVKGVVGWISQSQALTADAVHSLSDIASDLAVLIGVDYWTAPADDCHPHGHGRIETLVSFFIGCALAFVALGLIHRAVTTLHLRHVDTVGWAALAAALLSLSVLAYVGETAYCCPGGTPGIGGGVECGSRSGKARGTN